MFVMSELPIPPWRTPKKAAKAKLPLSQEAIVDAAMRVLDAEGLDAVSMRRIATELGTGPASLYAHVANKDELLELMVERVAGEVRLPAAPDPGRWQEQLKEVARAVHRSMTEHRDLARAAMVGIPTGPNALRTSECLLAIMKAGSVPDMQAGWFLDRMFIYINGDAYEGSLWQAKIPEGSLPEAFAGEYFTQIHDYFQSLPADRFPRITQMVDTMFSGGSEERFEFGIDLLVRGLASYVEE